MSLFIIAKIQNQPVNRQTDKAKRVFIYNGVLLLSQKEWALVICTPTKKWVWQEDMLQEISQTQKNKCHVFSVIHENCKRREKRSIGLWRTGKGPVKGRKMAYKG